MSHSKSSSFKVPGYSIGKLLGRGATADVFLAVSQQTGTRLACKRITENNIENITLIKAELKALKSLSHENICNLQNFFQSDHYYYFMLDFCEGGTLEKYIVMKKRLPEDECKVIFKQILNCLNYCHSRGIAHRDLKPSNILITKYPEIKISDFGLSKLNSNSQIMAQTQCGTLYFMAPECFGGSVYDASRADIWSAGVVLLVMATGKLPWRATSIQRLVAEMKSCNFLAEPFDDLSREFNLFLRKIFHAVPENRLDAASLLTQPWFSSSTPSLNPSSTQFSSSFSKTTNATATHSPLISASLSNPSDFSHIPNKTSKTSQAISQSISHNISAHNSSNLLTNPFVCSFNSTTGGKPIKPVSSTGATPTFASPARPGPTPKSDQPPISLNKTSPIHASTPVFNMKQAQEQHQKPLPANDPKKKVLKLNFSKKD
ncbi:CAMK family protein kinase [Tritrichomonas foetus]|uniref:CAMK family protein kinase n=1 Tax=Tritrichomonas foetus TaxID=1144522 RepID=A0A1J4KJI6_9EUKA|nr:CAMK family protein kinase [Tritrichomonas foetus]|eukprot:OHT11371.1 CAMK family protein kinase [Tritrichomonas foetus]